MKSVSILERLNWTTEFSCVKAHTGTYGIELAYRLAKDAKRNRDQTVVFNRIPKSTLYGEIEKARKNGKKNGKTARKQPSQNHISITFKTGLN